MLFWILAFTYPPTAVPERVGALAEVLRRPPYTNKMPTKRVFWAVASNILAFIEEKGRVPWTEHTGSGTESAACAEAMATAMVLCTLCGLSTETYAARAKIYSAELEARPEPINEASVNQRIREWMAVLPRPTLNVD